LHVKQIMDKETYICPLSDANLNQAQSVPKAKAFIISIQQT
jgi:hypothetical protein